MKWAEGIVAGGAAGRPARERRAATPPRGSPLGFSASSRVVSSPSGRVDATLASARMKVDH